MKISSLPLSRRYLRQADVPNIPGGALSMVYLKIACALLLSATAIQALVEVPLGVDVSPRGRIDNGIGVSDLLPMSTKATKIFPSDARPTIDPNTPLPAVSPNAPSYNYLKTARHVMGYGNTKHAVQVIDIVMAG